MIKDIFFTVIIPLYNKEESILDTVNSVLQQTYSNFELLIVNDGSTDNSVKLLEDNIVDARLTIVNQTNLGVSAARNAGVLKSSSDYILFLDADDILLENALTIFSDLIYRYPQGQVYTSNFYIEEIVENNKQAYCKSKYEKLIKNNYREYWLRDFFIRTGNTVIRKKALLQSGLFDVRLSYYEDLALTMNLLKDRTIIVYSPTPTFLYKKKSSELSKGPSDITKSYAYWFTLKDKSFWAKLILALNLHTTMRHIHYSGSNGDLLKRKYRSNFLYIFLSRILIKLQ